MALLKPSDIMKAGPKLLGFNISMPLCSQSLTTLAKPATWFNFTRCKKEPLELVVLTKFCVWSTTALFHCKEN